MDTKNTSTIDYTDKLKRCLNVIYSNDTNKTNMAIKYFTDNNFENFKDYDINVRILKGGSYKIKNFYLENNILNDIRGASVLLTQVEEEIIPNQIEKMISKDCIVYCGGGNIFAILPEDTQSDFNIQLEIEAQKYLISGNIAYYLSEPIRLSKILGKEYRETLRHIEQSLDDRKKTKIYNSPTLKSCINKIAISNTSETAKASNSIIDIPHTPINDIKYTMCSHCNTKKALYLLNDEKLCASCLHKNLVGKSVKHTKYINEYKKYAPEYYKEHSQQIEQSANSLQDIDEDYIAVVYGDGNNMGGIIQGLEKITDMMRFSETVKSVANKSVFCSMADNDITKFEVVGLGGDDVFVIVEAKKSIKFALSLIQHYNQDFQKYYPNSPSTMAVGIAIAKTNTPIKIVLERAEEELSKAKKLCKDKVLNGLKDTGALSFTIIDSYEGNNGNLKLNYPAKNTLLPYETETAQTIIKYVDSLKRSGDISITKIYNLSESFKKAESIEEANLFFNYMNAKGSKSNTIILPNLINEGADIDIKIDEHYNAFYVKDYSEKLYIWDDIIDLLKYTEGANFNNHES